MNTATRTRLRNATSAFDPSTVANMQGWWKADGVLYQDSARTTLATADGDPVGSFSDASGSSRHMAQATTTKRPLLRLGANGINSLPVLQLDGVDDWMRVTWASIAQPATIYAVLKLVVAANTPHIIDGGAYEENLLWVPGTADWTAEFGVNLHSGVTMNTSAHLFVMKVNGASSTFVVDSTSVSGNMGTVASTGMAIGATGGAAGDAPSVKIGEVIRYNALTATGDDTAIRAYLKSKWGTP